METSATPTPAPAATAVPPAPAAAPSREIFADLAAAQAEFSPVVFNRVNPAFRSKYADLAACIAAVRPALNRHGLFLTQRVSAEGNAVQVETILMHKSGQELRSGVLSIPIDTNGRNRAQAFGSARTYGCRYSLSSFLGIAADEDDDGNACAAPAPAAQRKTTPPPAAPESLPAAVIAAGGQAAKKGTEAYKRWLETLDTPVRQALRESPYAAVFWKEAKACTPQEPAAQAPSEEAAA